MSIKIEPGDFLQLSCPVGATPIETVGQSFPENGKEKSFAIIAIDKNQATLGPLRAGEYEVGIHCTGGLEVKETILLTALKKENLPEKQPPAAPFLMAFPLWFWIALALILCALMGLVVWIVKLVRERQVEEVEEEEAAPPNGQELLEHYLKTVTAGRWAQKDDPQTVSQLYSSGFDCVRTFLEFKLHFKASWATSSEFIGTLKASLLGYPKLNELAHQVETVLHQADLVRFSKDIPPKESREHFVKTLQLIHAAVMKVTRSEQGQSSPPSRKRE